jgi:hypothetical protein
VSKNDEKYFGPPLEEEAPKIRPNDRIEKRDPVKFKNGVIYGG